MTFEPRNSNIFSALLLIRAEPPGHAEKLCRRLVHKVRLVNGVLEIDADPALSGAINTFLVKKGVTVSELRRAA